MCRSLNQMFPYDEIQDGIQEQDIDGDGKIHMMRMKSPCGAWKASTVDDRCMVRRRPDDTEGTFYNIYREGIIEKGADAQLMAAPNKYGADFNRCFPCGWKPEGKQKGAGQYPLQNIETRNMAEFLKTHPNLVSLITFHTMGGVYLYPPASFHSKEAPAEDMNRYQKIAAMATEETGFPAVNICDGYIGTGMSSSIVGSFSDYALLGMGVMSMECECWDIDARVGSTLSFPPKPVEKTDTFTETRALNVVRWLDENTGGEGYRRWEKFQHPQLGEVELGGLDFKFVIQNPPCKFLFEEVEKHVRFVRRHVKTLPHLIFERLEAQKIEGNTYKVTAQVTNVGYLPTYGTKMAETLKRAAPLTVSISGDAEVVAGKLLFYLPAADRTAGLEASIQQSTAILDQSAAMLASQEKMEQELDALLSGEQAPEEMPYYDNIQSIMVELNGILSDAQEYSLRFSSAQGEDHVMERRVTMPFTCSSYATAKSILHRIQESALRCQLEDLVLFPAGKRGCPGDSHRGVL